MMTAEEARKKLEETILNDKIKAMSYIFKPIEEAIKDHLNWIQIIDRVEDPRESSMITDHYNFLIELGYKIERTQAVREMEHMEVGGKIINKFTPMIIGDVTGPYYYRNDIKEPLMCYRISW